MDGTGHVRLNDDVVAGGAGVVRTLPNPVTSAIAYYGEVATLGVTEVFVVDAPGGTSRRVSQTAGVGGTGVEPNALWAWTPDGARLVYSGHFADASTTGMWSVRADGSDLQQLGPDLDAAMQFGEVTFVHQARALVCTQYLASSGQIELIATDWNGGDHRSLSQGVISGGSWIVELAVSPDGQRVVYRTDAYAGGSGNYELYSVSIDAQGHVRIHDAMVANGAAYRIVGWSQDGQRIHYLADADVDQRVELYSAALDGSGVVKLSGPLTGVESIEHWGQLADGRILYSVALGTGANEWYVVDQDGTNLTALDTAGGAGNELQLWASSASGDRVLGRGDLDTLGIEELYSFPLDGSARTKVNPPLASGASGITGAYPAPDNTWVVYCAETVTAGDLNVFVSSIDGSQTTLLNPTAPGTVSGARVLPSPDSSRILFAGDFVTDEVYEAFLCDPTGADLTKLNPTLPAFGDVSWITWLFAGAD